jgi:hypothetical protein
MALILDRVPASLFNCIYFQADQQCSAPPILEVWGHNWGIISTSWMSLNSGSIERSSIWLASPEFSASVSGWTCIFWFEESGVVLPSMNYLSRRCSATSTFFSSENPSIPTSMLVESGSSMAGRTSNPVPRFSKSSERLSSSSLSDSEPEFDWNYFWST